MRKWRFIHSVDGQGPPVITDASAYPEPTLEVIEIEADTEQEALAIARLRGLASPPRPHTLADDLRAGLAHWRALASDAAMRGQPARMNGEQLAYLIAVAEAAVDLAWRAEGPMDELEAKDRMRLALDALASA